MQSELRTCEDCAGTDLQVSWDETGFTKWWHVRCAECSNERSGGTQSEAIAAWNTRASDAEITRLTEALRAAEEREKGLREAGSALLQLIGPDNSRVYANDPQVIAFRQALAGAKP